MRTSYIRRFLALLAIVSATGACASMRKVDVGSADNTVYYVNVTNQRTASMTVSWTDGTNTRELGTVAGGRTERFIVAGPKTTSISVTGRTSAGVQSGPYAVTLVAGSPQTVILR